MKNWTELTDNELANLEDEEIATIRNLILAEAGIPIVINAPVKPEIENPKKDLTIYVIKGLGSSIAFTDVNEATEVVEMLKRCKTIGLSRYGSKYYYFTKGSERSYDGEPSEITIESQEVFSEELERSIRNKYIDNKQQIENYEFELSNYNKLLARQDEATEDFYNALDEARKTIQRRENLKYQFQNTYLKLAEGNQEIALNFLKKAYIVSEEDEQYILNNPIKTE